ncbi:MAG: cyclic nucleotide-binding domain-containing protein [Desulfobacterales bacterium]|nr:cyclic nucleotide-binding domain-containing protein [Desulfobacterales bacterium]
MITGRVKIFKLSSEGKEQILHFFGPGNPSERSPSLPASNSLPMPQPWSKAGFSFSEKILCGPHQEEPLWP